MFLSPSENGAGHEIGFPFPRGPAPIWPAARTSHSMVYHAGLDRVVLFGGDTESGSTNETWAFDSTSQTWKLMNSPTNPAARSGQAMIYDPVGGLILLFGGTNFARWPETRSYNDTWIFDLATAKWRQLAPIKSPSARYDHGMVYVASSQQVVLFGGRTESGWSNETWAYNLTRNAWTRLAPQTSPKAAESSSQMAYNTASRRIVLLIQQGASEETWIYDPASVSWSKTMSASQPRAVRHYGALVDNPANGRIVLFGGDSLTHGDTFTTPAILEHFNDTWRYDVVRDEWFEMHPAANPGDRAGHAMVFHSPTDRFVLFGGSLGYCPYRNDEMWSYDSAANSWTRMDHGAFPSSPLGLYGRGSDQSAELTWKPPRQPGTSPIVGYRIHWAATQPVPPASVHDWATIEIANVTAFAHRGLLNGMTYTYFVSAVSRAGEGPLSCYARVTPSALPENPVPQPRLDIVWFGAAGIPTGAAVLLLLRWRRGRRSGGTQKGG
jgi:N-acetylneuraminic acid mutarotase